jgi:hypothetical protein
MNIAQKLTALILICFAFCACKTEEVYFNVTEPAPVTIPYYVKKVGIINCSVLSDSNGVRKAIDNVISLKSAALDKDCSNECIRGLKDALVQSNIFKDVQFLDGVNIKSSYPGAFPPPLSWGKVEEICRSNNLDVLFSLELFHTGTRINLGAPGSFATTISLGWRIYDPQNKIVLDEYTMAQDLNFGGSGLIALDAVSALMNHKENVMGVSYQMGQSYTNRVLPYVIRVCHEFYINGSTNFKIARRMADAGDWNSAADLWNKETTNPKPKISARAYYNLAIINEMNGNVDSAIGLAQRAYETGGKRLALFYLNALRNRKVQDDILRSQAH